jgi:hypothetical protein
MTPSEIQKEWFVFVIGRLGFDPGSTWYGFTLSDGSKWSKVGLGFYWRYAP